MINEGMITVHVGTTCFVILLEYIIDFGIFKVCLQCTEVSTVFLVCRPVSVQTGYTQKRSREINRLVSCKLQYILVCGEFQAV